MEFGGRDGGVTLLRYGPCISHPAPNPSARNKDKFLSKLRRRSRSVPRNNNNNSRGGSNNKEAAKPSITYSANGERVRNSEGCERTEGVELVGFSSSLSSWPHHQQQSQPQPKRRGTIATTNKTSAEIKEARRARNIDMTGGGRWASSASATTTEGGGLSSAPIHHHHRSMDYSDGILRPSAASAFRDRKLSASDVMAEREKFFTHQRQLLVQSGLKNNNEVFSKFLREREERMRRLTGGFLSQSAFLSRGESIGSSSTVGAPETTATSGAGVTHHRGSSVPIDTPPSTEAETEGRQAKVLEVKHYKVIIDQDQAVSDAGGGGGGVDGDDGGGGGGGDQVKAPPRERVIPIQVLDEPMLPSLDSSSTSSSSSSEGRSSLPSSASEVGSSATVVMDSFPSALFSDLKLDTSSSSAAAARHPPSLEPGRIPATFGRLGSTFNDDISSAFRSGFRESFFGMSNFGKFPSFGPILPSDSLNLSPHIRRSSSGAKKRLQKTRSSTDSPKSSHRLVTDLGGDLGNSETESEDDLDSVSVVARTRDRLSGTGSTQSEDSSTQSDSTVSNDSGIAEEGETRSRKPPRPISAVPSEISDVSILSNNSRGSDEKKCDSLGEDGYPGVGGGGDQHADLAVPPLQRQVSSDPDENSKKLEKAYLIAKELLSTEIHYVAKLHLIDQVFHFKIDQENRSSNLFSAETVPIIFSNIKSIYKFHAEFLLPKLKERMEMWTTSVEHQRIGDIMLRYSPFLIMYTEYVKNFDTAMRTINNLYTKNSKFANIMDEIHSMRECENLSLQHHMLCPVQRIPRYEMLLRDYLTNLPADSLDRSDAESALKQVSQAAAHANDSMKRIEQFKKLLEVQESIGGSLDLVSPTRELIKEGRIVKISARTSDHQDRYMFLLTDLLLLCSQRKSMISGAQFGVRAKFQVENLQVHEGDNLVTANTFYLRDESKYVELYTSTRAEKEEWLQALYFAIQSLYTRKSSLRVGRDILRPLDCEIGKKKPHLQKLETASKCGECSTHFSILKHKHNCRTCGAVFCGKCSDYKHSLAWEDGRKGRVCRSCNNLLTSQNQPEPNQHFSSRPRGLLEVPADSASVYSGWLVLRPPGKSSSTKRYFVLLEDFVLYSFRTETDEVALTATPVPGFVVTSGGELRGDNHAPEKDRDRIIKLFHPSSKRVYYFAGNNTDDVQRWVEALKMAARAELPEKQKSAANSSSDKDDLTDCGSEELKNSDTQSTSSTEYENS